ncbi:MAG: FAD-binding protein [Pseudonocardiaceae bacterium]
MQLRSEVEIDASPERVWAVLTDFPSFPRWNPFIRSAHGRLRPGEQLTIKLRLGRRLMTFRPRVTVVDEPRELRWLARQWVPGLFDVDRRFLIESVGATGSRFVQSESGSGVLAPVLMPLMRRGILRGYHALNAALKSRVEDGGTDQALPMPDGDEMTRALHRGSTNGRSPSGPPEWKKRITSHETFTHDSIDSLGYDWERVADPSIKPKFPLRIYLPQTTDDVITVVKEAKARGERLAIRSKGHSSNDLVLTDGGSLLVTEKLADVLAVDEHEMTATVQAGAVSAEVDDYLATRGLGLPIIGDHNHITVGGFASVGGISPASHRFGLFVDTIERLEYVTWDGELVACGRAENAEHFYRVLAGLGRHGVIVTITVRIIRVDKYGTVLKNEQTHYYDVDRFVEGSAHAIRNPGAALMERGVWVNFALPNGKSFGAGQFSAYHPTDQTGYARGRDNAAYNVLHSIGYVAGRLPRAADRALKYVGMTGVLFSPSYATMKNVEFFTDKILDSTVGDPTRMFIVLAPLNRYEDLFHRSYELMLDFRRRHGCFTFVSVYVKSIKSEYLAQGRPDDQFCELMFYCGIDEGGMGPAVLEDLVNRLDDICIENHGFRYMHSRTSKDPARRDLVDPNMHYVNAAGAAGDGRSEAVPHGT